MNKWWRDIDYFDPCEFDSPDDPGSGKEKMREQFITMLDEARHEAGFPFRITSGYRTPEHNMEVGGVDSSSHVRGWAADIAVQTSRHRFLVVDALRRRGVHRFGIGERFVHVDMDPDKDSDVMWTY